MRQRTAILSSTTSACAFEKARPYAVASFEYRFASISRRSAAGLRCHLRTTAVASARRARALCDRCASHSLLQPASARPVSTASRTLSSSAAPPPVISTLRAPTAAAAPRARRTRWKAETVARPRNVPTSDMLRALARDLRPPPTHGPGSSRRSRMSHSPTARARHARARDGRRPCSRCPALLQFRDVAPPRTSSPARTTTQRKPSSADTVSMTRFSAATSRA